MGVAPSIEEVRERAVSEGQRRLDQSLLELAATGFIAGFTVVFGVVALGIADALLKPLVGEAAHLGGALAFGVSIVFLVVGRAELFSENFLDPVTTAVSRSDSWLVGPLVRLWGVTLVVNLAGGGLMAAILSVDGVLPPGTPEALTTTATDFVARRPLAEFAASVAGGVLVTLLSFLLLAVDSVGGRMALAYSVGVLLALGPFDHVVVTMLHVAVGVFFGGGFGAPALAETALVVTAGNFVGGLGIGASTHIAQTHGARQSDGYSED